MIYGQMNRNVYKLLVQTTTYLATQYKDLVISMYRHLGNIVDNPILEMWLFSRQKDFHTLLRHLCTMTRDDIFIQIFLHPFRAHY